MPTPNATSNTHVLPFATEAEPLHVRVARLEKAGKSDAAWDLVFNEVDALFYSGDFAAVDKALLNISVNSSSADLLVSLLTATLPGKGRLSARKAFYSSVELSLKKRGEYEDGLLRGLED